MFIQNFTAEGDENEPGGNFQPAGGNLLKQTAKVKADDGHCKSR